MSWIRWAATGVTSVLRSVQFLNHFSCSHCVCLAFFRYISYPRTETNIFPKDLDLAALVEQQIPDHAGALLGNTFTGRGGHRNGSKSDQAHPPIHPTKYMTACRWVFLADCRGTPREVRAQAWVQSALWALTLGTA